MANQPGGSGLAFLNFLTESRRLDSVGAGRVANAMASASHAADTILLELGLLAEPDLATSEHCRKAGAAARPTG